jgi:hypothetical protein
MSPAPTAAAKLPRYERDATPVVKLPPGRTLGAVTGLQVSPDGHIWLLHIASKMEWGPPGQSKDPAARLPSVVEFDAQGNFLQAWGGPDWLPRVDGRTQWPRQEETIAFDSEGSVWVFGADKAYDHAAQRFTRDGKLLLRIGRFGETGGDLSETLLGGPTDCWVDAERREAYISDGYVNHRVAVFDSQTGAFKRSFGAYGECPLFTCEGLRRFNTPVHAISHGPEGHLYVCDRKNDRVQVFDAVGRETPRFVREIRIERPSPYGTTFNLAFTPDGKFMLINDGSHARLWVVDLAAWRVVDDFYPDGKPPPDLTHTLHKIATDPAGNLLLGRTTDGIQRLIYKGNA